MCSAYDPVRFRPPILKLVFVLIRSVPVRDTFCYCCGLMKGLVFSLVLLALMTLATGQGSGADSYYDFKDSAQGWAAAGTPGAEWQKYVSAVAWDAAQGHQESGCLKIADSYPQLKNGIYALSPAMEVGPRRQQETVFSGWAKWDKAVPHLGLMMLDAQGKFLGVYEKWKTSDNDACFAPALTNGWSRFELMVSKGKLPENCSQIKMVVRPSPTYERASGFTGTVWLDDMTWRAVGDQPLSLKTIFNRGFTDGTNGVDGWTNQGGEKNDMRGLTPGKMDVQGIPFQIADPATNGNRSVLALRQNEAPAFVSQATLTVPADQTNFETLYLLHTAAWAKPGSEPMGVVDWVYASGQKESMPIIVGRDVADWWSGQAEQAVSVPMDQVNPQKQTVLLYAAALTNPKPNQPVKELVFRVVSPKAIWLVLSATASIGPSKLQTAIAATRHMENWTPFMPALAKTAPNAVSLKFLMDAPAGKHGHVTVDDLGNFRFVDGTPVRFWGTNIHSNYGIFPSHEQAEVLAETLARYGINLVRLHYMDGGLVRVDMPNSDPSTHRQWVEDERLDRFEYMVKCFKDHGIYILIDNIVGVSRWALKDSDGVVEAAKYGAHRSWAYYDPRLKELGTQFLVKLLSRKNRYTQMTLAEDPVVAMGLLINEQAVFWDYLNFQGQPEHYRLQLKKRFNQWLLKQYSNRSVLESAWRLPDGSSALKPSEDPMRGTVLLTTDEFSFKTYPMLKAATDPKASLADRVRAQATVRFLQYLQLDYTKEMTAQARRLGAKFPILATNILMDQAEYQPAMDARVLSQNDYWDHPEDLSEPFMHMIANTPVVSTDPTTWRPGFCESIVVGSTLAGCAMITTETDTMWPHEWRSSHMILMAATGAHQQLDAICQYNFAGSYALTWADMMKVPSIVGHGIELFDPAVVSSMIAGAILYRRGDVAPARNLVRYEVPLESSLEEGYRRPGGAFPNNYLPFVTGQDMVLPDHTAPVVARPGWVIRDKGDGTVDDGMKRTRELDAKLKAQGVIPPQAGLGDGSLTSDTLQIVRDWKQQFTKIDTPRSQALTGFIGSRQIDLSDVTMLCQTPFATIQVSSLDDHPLARSQRILLIAIARADNQNSEMTFSMSRSTPQGGFRGLNMKYRNFTKGPVLIEPVEASLLFNGSSVRLTPLKSDMVPDETLARIFTSVNGRVRIEIGKQGISAWYLVERQP